MNLCLLKKELYLQKDRIIVFKNIDQNLKQRKNNTEMAHTANSGYMQAGMNHSSSFHQAICFDA